MKWIINVLVNSVAVVLGALSVVVGPLLVLLTLPFNVMMLGLYEVGISSAHSA